MTQPVDRVAVVGPDVAATDGSAEDGLSAAEDGVPAAVEAAGAALTGLDEAGAIVAVGERAVATAAKAGADRSIPVLPIGVGRLGIARSDAPTAIEALVAGTWRSTPHPLLSVAVGDDGTDGRIRTRSAFTVSLMTVQSARISEYALSLSTDRTETFRADGVVVATPLGSDGYAGAAGAPALEPGAGVAVVPVAPFRIRHRRWVTADGVTLSVEREEEPVAVATDGVVRGEVSPHEPIRIVADGSFAVISPSAVSDNGASDWKNSNESSTE